MKPLWWLDGDGVLFNFITPAVHMINAELGTSHQHDDVKEWDIMGGLSVPPDVARKVYKRMTHKHYCRSLPVYDGAQEAVAELRNYAEVRFATSPFPDDDAEYWMYERTRALCEHFGAKRSDVVHIDEKWHLDGDALLDDKPEHVKSWHAKRPHKTAMLWARNTNKDSDWMHRVSSWGGVLRVARKLWQTGGRP